MILGGMPLVREGVRLHLIDYGAAGVLLRVAASSNYRTQPTENRAAVFWSAGVIG